MAYHLHLKRYNLLTKENSKQDKNIKDKEKILKWRDDLHQEQMLTILYEVS
jgi:hypothetical protein